VALNANLSRDLLLSIFQREDAIAPTARHCARRPRRRCRLLPPAQHEPVIARKLGTRHRAAIGITEDADCLALVASGKPDASSVAAFGELETDVTLERVEERIAKHFSKKRARSVRASWPTRRPTGSAAGDSQQDSDWKRAAP